MSIDKEALLKGRFGQEEVEIPGVGTVVVRPLTRGEALAMKGKEIHVAELERYMLSTAMVEPKLSEAEVKEWQDNSPAGDMEIIVDAIVRLSGMNKSAPKEAMKNFRE